MGLEEGMDNPSLAENPLRNRKLKSEYTPKKHVVGTKSMCNSEKGSWVPGISKQSVLESKRKGSL